MLHKWPTFDKKTAFVPGSPAATVECAGISTSKKEAAAGGSIWAAAVHSRMVNVKAGLARMRLQDEAQITT